MASQSSSSESSASRESDPLLIGRVHAAEISDEGERSTTSNPAKKRSGQNGLRVLTISTVVVAFSNCLLMVAWPSIFENIICCRRDNDKCLDEKWCAGKEVQSQLSMVINGRTTSRGIFEAVYLLPAILFWSFVAKRYQISAKWILFIIEFGILTEDIVTAVLVRKAVFGDTISLPWVVTTAPALYAIGGGPVAYIALRDAVSADFGKSFQDRSTPYVVLWTAPALASLMGGFLTKGIMDWWGAWPCLIVGLVINFVGILMLPFVSAPPLRLPRQRAVLSWHGAMGLLQEVQRRVSWLILFLLLFDSIAYSPLSSSLGSFGVQYISARFSLSKQNAGLILSIGEFFPVFLPLSLLLLGRFLPSLNLKSKQASLNIAIACVSIATLASAVMAVSPSWQVFSVAACFAYIGTSYTLYTKCLVALWTPEAWHFALFGLKLGIEAFVRALVGQMLDWTFQRGFGWPYVAVAAVCLVSLLLLLPLRKLGKNASHSETESNRLLSDGPADEETPRAGVGGRNPGAKTTHPAPAIVTVGEGAFVSSDENANGTSRNREAAVWDQTAQGHREGDF